MALVAEEWSPAPALVAVGWVVAAVAAVWSVALALSGADPAGLLIGCFATVGSAFAALFATRARPRLRADPDGITVGGLVRPRHYPWPFVEEVRVVRARRFGLSASLLEIDTVAADGTERLLVFGRLDLAADPEDVAPQIRSLRP